MTKYDYAVLVMIGVVFFDAFVLLARRYNMELPKVLSALHYLLLSSLFVYIAAATLWLSRTEITPILILGVIFAGAAWTALVAFVLWDLLGPQNLDCWDREAILRSP